MGPPIFIGGKKRLVVVSHVLVSFNGATDFYRWKRVGDDVTVIEDVLQWGHRFLSVERRGGRRHVPVHGASMGPPIFIGGKAALPSPCLRLVWRAVFERCRALS